MIFTKPEYGNFANGQPFVRIGQGKQPLVIIPGLGDSFSPVTAMPQYNAWYYRRYAHIFTVYIISRKSHLSSGYTTRDMAADYASALKEIGSPVHIVGLSMGSMIAQYIASDFPGAVNGLVLALSGARGTPQAIARLEKWKHLAYMGKWKKLYADTIAATFSGCRRIMWQGLIPIFSKKPAIPSDFIVSADACINHDASTYLTNITAQTLVIGGQKDKLVPKELFFELKGLIQQASLKLIEGSGHGVFEDRKKKFDNFVINFLRSIP